VETRAILAAAAASIAQALAQKDAAARPSLIEVTASAYRARATRTEAGWEIEVFFITPTRAPRAARGAREKTNGDGDGAPRSTFRDVCAESVTDGGRAPATRAIVLHMGGETLVYEGSPLQALRDAGYERDARSYQHKSAFERVCAAAGVESGEYHPVLPARDGMRRIGAGEMKALLGPHIGILPA
jgi:hypothetical protein